MQLDSNYHEIIKTLKYPYSDTLFTANGGIFFCDDCIVKISPISIKDVIQSVKERKIYEEQDIDVSSEKCTLNGKHYKVEKFPLYAENRFLANILCSKDKVNIERIVASHFSLSKVFPRDPVLAKTYFAALRKNFREQKAHLHTEYSHELGELESVFLFLMAASEANERLNARISALHLCHGDVHPGNILLHGSRCLFLDPSTGPRYHSRNFVWNDLAALAGSSIMLAREDVAENVISCLDGLYHDFDLRLFSQWMILKSLVRVRFERSILNLNGHMPSHRLYWRKELVTNGLKRLIFYIDSSNLLIRRGRRCFSQNDLHVIINRSDKMLETLNFRRVELVYKSTVLLAVYAAILAADIQALSTIDSGAVGKYARFLALVSLFAALIGAIKTLGIIKRLSKPRGSRRIRGRIFFFGWIAGQEQKVLREVLLESDPEKLIDEVGRQAVALSLNLEDRYAALRWAYRWAVIALTMLCAYAAVGPSIELLNGVTSWLAAWDIRDMVVLFLEFFQRE
ncbi:hypothetical protein [Rhodobium gokarnense]|uniref:Pycsar effector protein domain-containing protein n=1 Tax=Rhodobium gokarnense TaxID=364296 RepID=A0ABT3HAI0_9HYPH|nr:hypothetical protein [Rhodobium gokarnense]MCW2307385.1 hypothetical protein [Rhodobium gokarnense]